MLDDKKKFSTYLPASRIVFLGDKFISPFLAYVDNCNGASASFATLQL